VVAVVLFNQRLHTLVDIFAIGHISDGPPEQGTDTAERISAMEGTLWRSEACADTDEYADGAITFKGLAGYGVAVIIGSIGSVGSVGFIGSLPVPLLVFAPGLVPSPSTWVIRLQGTIHVYVTVDTSFLKEAWSGGRCSSGIADVDSFRIAGIEAST
jgi:hypothetical protein